MANETVSVMKILDSQGKTLAEHDVAADWSLGFDNGHGVLHVPVTLRVYGEAMAIGDLALQNIPVTIQIARSKFPDFEVKEIILSSFVDDSVPDSIATVKARSRKRVTKAVIDNWLA